MLPSKISRISVRLFFSLQLKHNTKMNFKVREYIKDFQNNFVVTEYTINLID